MRACALAHAHKHGRMHIIFVVTVRAFVFYNMYIINISVYTYANAHQQNRVRNHDKLYSNIHVKYCILCIYYTCDTSTSLPKNIYIEGML